MRNLKLCPSVSCCITVRAVTAPLRSLLCFLSSIVHRLSSIVYRPSSIVHRFTAPLRSRLCFLSSLVHRPSSIVSRPSSLVSRPSSIVSRSILTDVLKTCLIVSIVSGPVMRTIAFAPELGELTATIVSLRSYIWHEKCLKFGVPKVPKIIFFNFSSL